MKLTVEFTCIDGNIAKRNVHAYCRYKRGYLTAGLQKTHRCIERGCKNYIPLKDLCDIINRKTDNTVHITDIKNN